MEEICQAGGVLALDRRAKTLKSIAFSFLFPASNWPHLYQDAIKQNAKFKGETK
jgi:hypothetical protein